MRTVNHVTNNCDGFNYLYVASSESVKEVAYMSATTRCWGPTSLSGHNKVGFLSSFCTPAIEGLSSEATAHGTFGF
jgi:hypothetical protein